MSQTPMLPEPIRIDCASRSLDGLMQAEWLVTNKLGSYASSTVIGANSRRYHGLLVASTIPPVGRQVLLSVLGEQVILPDRSVDLSTFRFAGAFSPAGYAYLKQFIHDVPPTWVYEVEEMTITRQLTLAENENVLTVRYMVDGPAPVTLRVRPFVALRDFHALRRSNDPHQLTYTRVEDGLRVEDQSGSGSPCYIGSPGATVLDQAQWWYRFQYGEDIRRGQEGHEDLYTPGVLEIQAEPGQWVQVVAATEPTAPPNFDATLAARRERLGALASAVGDDADLTTRRLAVASDDFLVNREMSTGRSATILAGYHWFADWGRDTFIALTGIALLTGRLQQARQILRTFAEAMREGMIPNRFDDYGGSPHYNSIDASLWFIQAVDRYVNLTDDEDAWRQFAPAVRAIVGAYQAGTQFHIRADADGLIAGGSDDTQLTWMDVKYNNQAMTPRQGKAVEINALYLEALHMLARRLKDSDPAGAEEYAAEAQRVADSFAKAFWFEDGGHLYDCIGPDGPDASLRPNQVIALAQPHCPLSVEQQTSALRMVVKQLLTPLGLRTLSPFDGRYRGRYGGSWESRDRAYHQGTAWAWLMGPLVQAHLKLNDFSDDARAAAAEWLKPFDAHLTDRCLGSISEIFDGEPPHDARGCVAQAWSVAEVLRAKLMVQRGHML